MSDDQRPAIWWARQDLRLRDNPAFSAAVGSGRPVLAVYALDDDTPGDWAIGAAQRWWRHQNLKALQEDLGKLGVPLVLRRGDAGEIVRDLAAEAGAELVTWNRRYTSFGEAQDGATKEALEAEGVEVETFAANLMREPDEVEQKSGGPYKMYTPFKRAWYKLGHPREPLPAPKNLRGFEGEVAGEELDAWGLEPKKPDWAGGMREAWRGGEAAARDRLAWFLDNAIQDYHEHRNRPDLDGTSGLSPYLHVGAISPHEAYHAAANHAERHPEAGQGAQVFMDELVWREFASHNLHHFPQIPDTSLRAEFERYPWSDDEDALHAWQKGRTGYPIIDAGMRQLWHIGWMHNRVRMIVGSFLTKDLGIHWKEGERWFWDCLVDADLGNNSMGWQWVAGSGVDSSPFFRVFNPTGQGRRFDPKGDYVRRWVPELAGLPKKYIHEPWTAPEEVLEKAGVKLGDTYPRPIVDHGRAREEALANYKRIKKAA